AISPTVAATSGGTAAQNSVRATTRSRILAAPAVRKRAFELGIDLEQVPSSHPSGRVTMEDVQTYAERKQQTTVAASPTPSTAPATVQSNGATRAATTPSVEQKADST